ncbi:MAG: NAD(P)H-hydrate epimerase [Phycisphaerae bacterium]
MVTPLTREQVRRVDQLALDRYCMPGLILMENAGRNAAAAIDEAYGPRGSAFLFCGPGNNGGDGCVIARHLHNAGWSLRIAMAGNEDRMTPDGAANYRIIKAMRLNTTVASSEDAQQGLVAAVRDDDVVIDALLGTGVCGEVRAPTSRRIDAINETEKRTIVAIDVPSGLDCDTGKPSNSTIRADLTITFVAPKTGFDAPGASAYTGRIVVADIGAPGELIREVLAQGRSGLGRGADEGPRAS